MNRRLEKFCAKDSGCFIVAGDKGAGKSTTLALFAKVYKNLGYKIFSQYPTKGAYQIPMVKKKIGNVYRSVVDKDWLYSHQFPYSCILLDEGKNIWPSRSYATWTQTDDDFFDFIRKNHCVIVIATLAYDQLDLNIRRTADWLLFLNTWFWHFTKVEATHTKLAKVADKQKEVLGFAGKRGMIKTNYEVVEEPYGNFNMWRRSYYKMFKTEYVVDEKPEPELIPWEDDLFYLKEKNK